MEFTSKYTIGDAVTVRHDLSKEVMFVRAVYFDARAIQYFVSNFKSSGYVYEDDLEVAEAYRGEAVSAGLTSKPIYEHAIKGLADAYAVMDELKKIRANNMAKLNELSSTSSKCGPETEPK